MTDDQPTFAALRWRAAIPGLYYGTPGRGPVGTTCQSCVFKTYTGGDHAKCGLANYTHGDKTTIRTRTPSCQYYQPPDMAPVIDAACGSPRGRWYAYLDALRAWARAHQHQRTE